MGILVCMRVVLSRRCQVSNLPFRFASLSNFLGPALTLPLLLGSGVAVPILRSSMPIFTARVCIKTTLDIPGALLREAKVQALKEITARLGITEQDVLAVGDGANDLGMLTRAGSGVALHAKPSVAAECYIRINHGDLTALLYVQGYSKDDFKTA